MFVIHELIFCVYRKRIEVSEDTPLFPEGALGKTPEGYSHVVYVILVSYKTR